MTLSEYMDPERFPLTTQDGLTPRLQFLNDVLDLDQLRAYLADGVTPTEEQWRRMAELEEKATARPELIAGAVNPVVRPPSQQLPRLTLRCSRPGRAVGSESVTTAGGPPTAGAGMLNWPNRRSSP